MAKRGCPEARQPPPAFKRRLSGKQPGLSRAEIDLEESTSQATRAALDVSDEVRAFQASVTGAAERPVKKSRGSRAATATASSEAPASPDAREVHSDNEEEVPDRAEERWYFAMGTKVVGVQHYSGMISDRESVTLRRQPTNPYDRNAIQVLNMRSEQVGHIPRELAAVLAPVMDGLSSSSSDELRFEGHIPRGSGNTFSMPLQLSVFGRDQDGSMSGRVRDLGQRLRSTYCAAARGAVEVRTSPQDDGTPVSELDAQTWAAIHGGKPPKQTAAAIGQRGPSMAEVIERELEGIFSAAASYDAAPEAEAPAALKTLLYAHQRKALYWMQKQERGMRVDELLEQDCSVVQAGGTDRKAKSKTAGGKRQVFFWSKETLKDGSFAYRNLATNTTFRKAPRLPRGGILADDMGLGKTITTLALFLSDSSRSDLALEAGAGGVQVLRASLVVCPLSVLFNWLEQARLHAPSLRVCVYHGPHRDREPKSWANYDLVLTTYDVVRSEAKDCKRGLGAVRWHRAVLDEAHVIKNHRAGSAKAVMSAVRAERKWCLTGTPIQNSIEDIFSLAQWMGLEPFDSLEWFNRILLRPLKNGDTAGLERLQVLLRTWCLRRTKEMKVSGPGGTTRSLLMLPQKTVEVIHVSLDSTDRKLYDALFEVARQHVKRLEQQEPAGGRQGLPQLLALLTRLRQLASSSHFLPSALRAELDAAVDSKDPKHSLALASSELGVEKVQALLRTLGEAQSDDCSICLEPCSNVITRCGHTFHRACIEAVLDGPGRSGSGMCPLCRQDVRKQELLEHQAADEGGAGEEPQAERDAGAKVRAVVDFVVSSILNKRDAYLKKLHKAVVFSQFTSLLDLVQRELHKRSIAWVRLDGSQSHEKRVNSLQVFSDHGHVQVILCSLKAAGVGINLTAADHVLLMDPWWNPAIEDQAIDRAHRLGQQRPVRAVRFVGERTVEERMLEVHSQKRNIMEGALARKTRDELQRMRLDLVTSMFEPFP